MGVVIYHNVSCQKSREALDLLNQQGCDITIVEYLDKKIGYFELKNILRFLGMKPREIVRTNELIYKELALDNPELTDDQLIKTIIKYPILLQRPIIANGEKAVIGRPASKIFDIL